MNEKSGARVAVLGAGAWGTALAGTLGQEHDVRLWSWQTTHAAEMERSRENAGYLPGYRLPDRVHPTGDLAGAVEGAEWVVVVVPSHAVRPTLEKVRALGTTDRAKFVCATKGIETDSLMLMSEVAEDVFGEEVRDRFVVFSGPSFAKEVVRSMPTNVVAGSIHRALAMEIQDLFSNDFLRVYTSSDPVGVEVGGALKNVIAIAAGACDGLGLGSNARAALITRGIAEMARLAAAKGGQVLTLAGLSGVGDLVLTCTGELSRNRNLGLLLGEGKPLDEALKALPGVAEGYLTTKSAHHLADRLGVELPITSEVYAVLYEQKSPQQAVRDLISRPVRSEW